MKERITSIVREIGREFTVFGPTEAQCKPRGFVRWCTLPYPDHPDGCPNFLLRSDCAPNAPYFFDVYDKDVFVASLDFDFAEYMEAKRTIHPEWTEKALRNSRHWQNHLRAELRNNIVRELEHPELASYVPIYNPEAMGVNVHLTCQRVGISLEWPPQQHMYRIALLAQPRIRSITT